MVSVGRHCFSLLVFYHDKDEINIFSVNLLFQNNYCYLRQIRLDLLENIVGSNRRSVVI